MANRTNSDVIYNAFLAHEWGEASTNMASHEIVSGINERLKDMGVNTWFDDDKMEHFIFHEMSAGIDKSTKVVVFITQRYMERLQSTDSNCSKEFGYATNHHKLSVQKDIIPVVIEPGMLNQKNWRGPLGMHLKSMLYIDMSTSSLREKNITKLFDRIMEHHPKKSKSTRNQQLPLGSDLIYKFNLDLNDKFPYELPEELATAGVSVGSWRKMRTVFEEIRDQHNPHLNGAHRCCEILIMFATLGVCPPFNFLHHEKLLLAGKRLEDGFSSILYEHGIRTMVKNAAGVQQLLFEPLQATVLYEIHGNVFQKSVVTNVENQMPRDVPRTLAEMMLTIEEWNGIIQRIDKFQKDNNTCYANVPYGWWTLNYFPFGWVQGCLCSLNPIFCAFGVHLCSVYGDEKIKDFLYDITEEYLSPHGIKLEQQDSKYVFITSDHTALQSLLSVLPKVQSMEP